MSKAVGFQWGVKINEKSPSKINKPKNVLKASMRKRRLDDDKKPSFPAINKKIKYPIIKGETLPLNRLIETLARPELNKLLINLVQIHPELQKTIQEIKPNVALEDTMRILHEKYEDIHKNLPYKGDLENDYSYLRVKPHINEFLNCLSDYILNYLPPVETNLLHSLELVDFATRLVTQMPCFHNNEFKYIHLKCYEQMANTWLIILNDLTNDDGDDTESENESERSERLYHFIKIVNDLDLKNKLSGYNHTSVNKFDKVLEFINDKQTAFNANSGINDLITIDYLNYSLTAHPST